MVCNTQSLQLFKSAQVPWTYFHDLWEQVSEKCKKYWKSQEFLKRKGVGTLSYASNIFTCNFLSNGPIFNSLVLLESSHSLDCLCLSLFRWFKFTLKPPNSMACRNFFLAIWDTSHWNFFVKFGLKTPYDIS